MKKEKSEDNAVQSIRPVVVRTENVAKELANIATANKVPAASLDFNILEVQTMKRMAENAEWEELTFDEVVQLPKDAMILDPKLEIRQVYEVEVFTREKTDLFKGMEISIGANSTMCKVYLTIKPGSETTYFEGFEEALKKRINKKKLRANLLIWIFDTPMAEVAKSLAARVRVNEHVVFDEKETFLIAEAHEPVPTINDSLIFHHEAKRDAQQKAGDRVDYSKRGFVVSVEEGELLIEYIKPKKGTVGRNCRGEVLIPKDPVVENEPAFNISEKIERKESEERVVFVAKQSGYITFDGGTYDINTEMDVTEISFKTTGSIETELDADVSINVKERDVFKDAIGMGMEVEVNEIQIEGNIGSGSKVRANKATIDGQTHQTSEVYAEELSINIHKGKAVGKKVHITRLEQGVVEGDSVTVSQATGGKIRAREITIEMLGSHVTMTATETIEVHQLKGSENIFIIDPVAMHSLQDDLVDNETKIKELKQSMRNLEQEIAKYEKLERTNAPAIADIKKRLIQYKKSGVQMPTAFVKKYKQFQKIQEHLVSLKKEFERQEDHLEMLDTKHQAFQSDIFAAKVICHDQWKGHNEIHFKLVDPPVKVSYIPPEFSTESLFMLQSNEDEETFFIAPVHT